MRRIFRRPAEWMHGAFVAAIAAGVCAVSSSAAAEPIPPADTNINHASSSTNLLPRRHVRRRYDSRINFQAGGEHPEMPREEESAFLQKGSAPATKTMAMPGPPMYTYPSAYAGQAPAGSRQPHDSMTNWITASVEEILQSDLMTSQTNAIGWGWLASDVMKQSSSTNAPAQDAADAGGDDRRLNARQQEEREQDIEVDDYTVRQAVVDFIRTTNQANSFAFRAADDAWQKPAATNVSSWQPVSPAAFNVRREDNARGERPQAGTANRDDYRPRTSDEWSAPDLKAMREGSSAGIPQTPDARTPSIDASRPGGAYWGLPQDAPGVGTGLSETRDRTAQPRLPSSASPDVRGASIYSERGQIFGPAFRSTSSDFASPAGTAGGGYSPWSATPNGGQIQPVSPVLPVQPVRATTIGEESGIRR